jgi:hypothetical protein
MVEEQHVHVACRLHGAPAHGEHVLAQQPIHAGDADRGEQAPDGRGDEADEERHDGGHRELDARVGRDGDQGDAGDEEDQGEADEEDVERDLVGSLLAGSALDEADHPVEEGLAGIGGDADQDPVGEDGRAPGDRAAVAARFPDDRRRLTGDGRLVDRGDALDHLAIARDHLSRLHHHDVPLAEGRGRDLLLLAVHQPPRSDVASHLPERVRLRLAPPLGHRLGEVGEDHREPEPQAHREGEPARRRSRGVGDPVPDPQERGQEATHLDHEHHRVPGHEPRIQLGEARQRRGAKDRGIEERRLPGPGGHG